MSFLNPGIWTFTPLLQLSLRTNCHVPFGPDFGLGVGVGVGFGVGLGVGVGVGFGVGDGVGLGVGVGDGVGKQPIPPPPLPLAIIMPLLLDERGGHIGTGLGTGCWRRVIVFFQPHVIPL